MKPSSAYNDAQSSLAGLESPGRRRFLRRAVAGAVFVAGLGGAGVSGRLRSREIIVPVPALPPELSGFRIGVVSDLHRSTWVSEEHCRYAAALAAGAACDVIVNLGDNVTGSAGYVRSALAGFREVDPPLGQFAVLGNHDHWNKPARITRALEQAGFRVLTDEPVGLSRNGRELYMVGLDDISVRSQPDLDAPFRSVPGGACVVVLSHNPDAIYHPRVRRSALVLAGHTHGSQVLGANAFAANCRYGRAHPHGLYREGDAQIYVTSGVGLVLPPFRLGVPPEVAVITLQPAGLSEPA